MIENISRADYPVPVCNLVKGLFIQITKAVKGLTQNLELPFDNELEPSIIFQILEGPTLDKITSFLAHAEGVVDKFFCAMRHRVAAGWLRPRA